MSSHHLCSYSCACAANFSDADLTAPPVLDAVLEPGDLLYFPRGYIHQVSAPYKFFMYTLNPCLDWDKWMLNELIHFLQ